MGKTEGNYTCGPTDSQAALHTQESFSNSKIASRDLHDSRLTNPSADYNQWPSTKTFHPLLNLAVRGNGVATGTISTLIPATAK